MTAQQRNGTGRTPKIDVEEAPPIDRRARRWKLWLGLAAVAVSVLSAVARPLVRLALGPMASAEALEHEARRNDTQDAQIKANADAQREYHRDVEKLLGAMFDMKQQFGEMRGELRGRHRGAQP